MKKLLIALIVLTCTCIASARYGTGGRYNQGKEIQDYLFHLNDPDSYMGFDGANVWGLWLGGNQVIDASSTGLTMTLVGGITASGTAKANLDIFSLTNTVNAADMDGTETSILWNQWYYDGTTPAIADAARIGVYTEQDWTSTVTTQDASFRFSIAENGGLREYMRIASDGQVSIHDNSFPAWDSVPAFGVDGVVEFNAEFYADVAGFEVTNTTVIWDADIIAGVQNYYEIDASSGYDQVTLGLQNNAGNQLVILDLDHDPDSIDADHAVQTNPTLFIHSAVNPENDNRQYSYMTHNQSASVYGTGLGYQHFLADALPAISAMTFTDDATTDEGIVFTINTTTLTGTTGTPGAGEFKIGEGMYDTMNNIVAAINTAEAGTLTAHVADSQDIIIFEVDSAGVAGNAYVTTETTDTDGVYSFTGATFAGGRAAVTGAPGHSPNHHFSGILEVDGAAYFDSTLTATTLTDGTLTITGGEILDATTLEATTTLGIEIGDTQQLVLTDGLLSPTTDNDIDLGTASVEFKDAFFDGTVTSDAFSGPLTGAITTDLITGTTNGQTIGFGVNNSIEISDNSETFGWLFTENTVQWSAGSTGVATVDANGMSLDYIDELVIRGQVAGTAIVDTTSLGKVIFYGDDDTASADEIAGQIEVIGTGTWIDGAEDAKMVLNAADNGVLNANQLVLNTNGSITISGAITIGLTGGIATNIAGNNTVLVRSGTENLVQFMDIGTLKLRDGDATNDAGFAVANDVFIVDKATADVTVKNDLIKAVDIQYVGMAVIKTVGIYDSGLQFNFATAANNTPQNLDLGAILPAGCVIVSAVLECDESVAGTGSTVFALIAGTTSAANDLLTTANTDEDGDTNVSAAGSSPIVAHSTAARNVWVQGSPTADWDTLTGGEWSIIIRYDDLGAIRANKGL